MLQMLDCMRDVLVRCFPSNQNGPSPDSYTLLTTSPHEVRFTGDASTSMLSRSSTRYP